MQQLPHRRGRTLGHRAHSYDLAATLLGMGPTFRELTVQLAQVEPGHKVLDVGCGTGSLSIVAKAWAGPAGEVHGIDAAPEMIALARRKAAQAGVDVDFQVGLIEDIHFPDDQFDVVLSSLMIHHLPGDDLKRRAFIEIHRVLKPGGRLVVVDFEPPTNVMLRTLATLLFGHYMMQTDVRAYPAMMEAAGFAGIEMGRTSHWAVSFVRGHAREAEYAQS